MWRWLGCAALVSAVGCGGGEEKPAPAAAPTPATAAPAADPFPAPTNPDARIFRFELGDHIIRLEVEKPKMELTAEGELFHFYRRVRDAAIQEYLAQEFDAAKANWDSGKVRAAFEENWSETKAGYDRLRVELEAQARFLGQYLEARKADATLKATDYWEQFTKNNQGLPPFESVTEWDRFARMFPSQDAISGVMASIPTTAEEAWKIHGNDLIVQAFGEEWAIGELRKRDPEATKAIESASTIGPIFGDTPSTLGRLNSAEDARAQVLAELRNRLALAGLLRTIKFNTPEDQAMFDKAAREELKQPLPKPLENVELLPESPAP